MYIREYIPPKRLPYKTNYDIVTLMVEINHNGPYNPKKKQILHYLECLNRILDEYNTEGPILNTIILLLITNFKVNENDSSIKEFCNLNAFECLNNE